MSEPDESDGVRHLPWAVVLMLAGVLLMMFAPLIVGIAPAGSLSFWSDADQAALQKASGEFHAVNSELRDVPRRSSIGSGGDAIDPVDAKARHAAAKAELDKQQARLRSAQSRPTRLLWAVRLLGVGLACAGVWKYTRGVAPTSLPGLPAGDKRTVTLPAKLEALKRRTNR